MVVEAHDRPGELADLTAKIAEAGINLDLVYGLPRQTAATFRETLARVVALRPDRLAIYSYAHVPWLKGHQKGIAVEELPPAETKAELLASAVRALTGAGYVPIGMDHFALPDDELARAAGDGGLWRNFMGYTVRRGSDLLGLGLSAIGDLDGTFFRWALRERKLQLCRWLFAGKMTLADVQRFEPLFAAGVLRPARWLPHWVARANGLAGMLAFSLFANRIRLDRVEAEDLTLGV